MQLELFEWQPPKPPAIVLCLPIWVKREACETARRLFAVPANQRARQLHREDGRFYKGLYDRGVNPLVADKAAHDFTALVRNELRRLQLVHRARDGAA